MAYSLGSSGNVYLLVSGGSCRVPIFPSTDGVHNCVATNRGGNNLTFTDIEDSDIATAVSQLVTIYGAIYNSPVESLGGIEFQNIDLLGRPWVGNDIISFNADTFFNRFGFVEGTIRNWGNSSNGVTSIISHNVAHVCVLPLQSGQTVQKLATSVSIQNGIELRSLSQMLLSAESFFMSSASYADLDDKETAIEEFFKIPTNYTTIALLSPQTSGGTLPGFVYYAPQL